MGVWEFQQGQARGDLRADTDSSTKDLQPEKELSQRSSQGLLLQEKMESRAQRRADSHQPAQMQLQKQGPWVRGE
jgi:hypothetical protein